MLITASIVSYKTDPVELERVLKNVSSAVDIIYLVDNSPLEESLERFADYFPKMYYISNPANTGFGSGHNLAIRRAVEAVSDYHVIINPDVYFDSGVIEELASFMNNHDEVGLVMPKVLYPSGEIQYLCKLLPTPADLFIRRFFRWKRYVDVINRRYELRFTGYDQPMEVPALSGCFMFVRTAVLQKTGGFDERYFMYAEDIDLCRRIGEIAKTVYYPGVCIYHKYAKGSYKDKKLLRYHVCSIIKYFNKWGWWFDRQRRSVNTKTLKELNYKG